MLRYFIVSLLNITSANEGLMYDCRVVNDAYRELFRETLNEGDRNIFEKIMTSDKEAILYKNHEKLGSVATLKIDEYKKSILDGTRWP